MRERIKGADRLVTNKLLLGLMIFAAARAAVNNINSYAVTSDTIGEMAGIVASPTSIPFDPNSKYRDFCIPFSASPTPTNTPTKTPTKTSPDLDKSKAVATSTPEAELIKPVWITPSPTRESFSASKSISSGFEPKDQTLKPAEPVDLAAVSKANLERIKILKIEPGDLSEYDKEPRVRVLMVPVEYKNKDYALRKMEELRENLELAYKEFDIDFFYLDPKKKEVQITYEKKGHLFNREEVNELLKKTNVYAPANAVLVVIDTPNEIGLAYFTGTNETPVGMVSADAAVISRSIHELGHLLFKFQDRYVTNDFNYSEAFFPVVLKSGIWVPILPAEAAEVYRRMEEKPAIEVAGVCKGEPVGKIVFKTGIDIMSKLRYNQEMKGAIRDNRVFEERYEMQRMRQMIKKLPVNPGKSY